MKDQIKDLIIESIEKNIFINKTEAEMVIRSGDDDLNVEFDLIVSVRAVTVNGEREEI